MNSASSFNNLKNGRLTGLANRMLGIEQPSSSNATTSSSQPQQPNPMPSIKRNLFGCRLDHEELHADLQQMLAEQRRVKSAQWSFDFETLKPMTGGRVQWRRVRVPIKPSSNTNSPTQQDRDDEKYLMISTTESDDDEEHDDDEEDDEALAVPEFYKRQRRLKLAEVDKNRMNVLANTANQVASNNQPQKTLSNSNSSTSASATSSSGAENQQPANKLKISVNNNNNNTNKQNVQHCAVQATPVKPRVSRPSRKLAQFDQLGKILTFSENRKVSIHTLNDLFNFQRILRNRRLIN